VSEQETEREKERKKMLYVPIHSTCCMYPWIYISYVCIDTIYFPQFTFHMQYGATRAHPKYLELTCIHRISVRYYLRHAARGADNTHRHVVHNQHLPRGVNLDDASTHTNDQHCGSLDLAKKHARVHPHLH